MWLTGSLNGRSWEYVRPLTVALLVLVPLALLCSRSLGSWRWATTAPPGWGSAPMVQGRHRHDRRPGRRRHRGGRPGGLRRPPGTEIARPLVGERTPGLLPAAIVGAGMVVYGDLVARRLFAPTELPVGVVTAIIGAPFLLWLLARTNRVGPEDDHRHDWAHRPGWGPNASSSATTASSWRTSRSPSPRAR